jgi:hypothetical protein
LINFLSVFINKTNAEQAPNNRRTRTSKMGFLCKEQVIKGLYLAIGSKHGVPKDLLLIIYRLTKDDSEVRQYHTDEIYRNTIPNYSSTSLFATGTGSALYTTSTEFPLGRGLEWAIKWEKNKLKKVRHTQIQVFGERDYLLKRIDYVREDHLLQHFFKRSHNKLKILYLNTSPADEVLDDYLNYLESDRDPGHRLYIDNFGEAIDCIGHDEIFIDS